MTSSPFPILPQPPPLLHLPSPLSIKDLSLQDFHSVRSRSRLTSLQLIQIPPTHRHVALILIHAACKALDILRTGPRVLLLSLLLLSRNSISSLHVVEAVVVHRLGIRVLRRLLVLVLRRFWLRRRAAAAEPAADGMADGRSDRNTAAKPQKVMVCQFSAYRLCR